MNYKDAKVVQALDYLVTSLKGGCSKLNLLKLVYLADRYHLRKFGRTVTGDSYRAMPYGPVADRTRVVIETIASIDGADAYLVNRPTARYEVLYSVRSPDLSYLSASEREALEAAVREFPRHDNIVDFTHLFPEWKRHEAEVLAGGRPAMDFDDFFLPCPEGEYCDVPDELVRMNREIFAESAR